MWGEAMPSHYVIMKWTHSHVISCNERWNRPRMREDLGMKEGGPCHHTIGHEKDGGSHSHIMICRKE